MRGSVLGSVIFWSMRDTKLLRQVPTDGWVVPVPLHWSRRWWRGYNQADSLASGLATASRIARSSPLVSIETHRTTCP